MTDPAHPSPFHEGECAVQDAVGVRERVAELGSHLIHPKLPDGAGRFIAAQPALFLGVVDKDGQPWASQVMGLPEFIETPNDETLLIGARPPGHDPAGAGLEIGADVGTLALEFASRRRFRINGLVRALGEASIALGVVQAFGNCPKYIQTRHWRVATDHETGAPVATATDVIEAEARRIIEGADTYFIASACGSAREDARHGADVSHRGGRPGFVHVSEDGRSLRAPDFMGNFMFNTLGNLSREPRCGLLFIDFDTGTTVQIAARAEILWDGPLVARFAGAERVVRFHVKRVVHTTFAVGLRFSPAGYSPFVLRTGSWSKP